MSPYKNYVQSDSELRQTEKIACKYYYHVKGKTYKITRLKKYSEKLKKLKNFIDIFCIDLRYGVRKKLKLLP